MSGFAMMFFQDPSLLQFQLRLEKRFNRNNLKTLFDITDIPKDSQLRQVLDNADNSNVYELFADLFRSLQRGKHFDLFRFIDDRYLMCLDGSGYFPSDTIHCPGCLTKTSANGHVRYERQILQPVIVCPGIRDPPRPLTRLCKELALIKTFRPKSLCRSWRNNIRKRLSSSAGKEGFLING